MLTGERHKECHAASKIVPNASKPLAPAYFIAAQKRANDRESPPFAANKAGESPASNTVAAVL